MADTLHRLSPLEPYAAQFAAAPETARLVEEPFVAMVDLWLDPAGPGADTAADVLGVGLPVAAHTVVDGSDASAIWLGPQEWLITSEIRDAAELERQLNEAVGAHGGAAIDVSAQRATLRLRGSHARDVLAKGCSLDLHPRVFPPGTAAQTMLALAAVVVIPLSENGTDYRILVRSSFARYLADWLLDAVAEYGVDW